MLAGSCVSMVATLHNLVRTLNVPLGEAVAMLSENPARCRVLCLYVCACSVRVYHGQFVTVVQRLHELGVWSLFHPRGGVQSLLRHEVQWLFRAMFHPWVSCA